MSNKDDGSRKENRESAQKKVDQVQSALSLTDEERRQLHDSISGNDYMDFHKIMERARDLFDPINIRSKKGESPRW